jgi:hypothetical protein
MAVRSVENVLKQAARLTPEERLIVASRLIEGVRHEMPARRGQPLKWRGLQGKLSHPAFGEDAQTYVTRTRNEDTAHRENAAKHNP